MRSNVTDIASAKPSATSTHNCPAKLLSLVAFIECEQGLRWQKIHAARSAAALVHFCDPYESAEIPHHLSLLTLHLEA